MVFSNRRYGHLGCFTFQIDGGSGMIVSFVEGYSVTVSV